MSVFFLNSKKSSIFPNVFSYSWYFFNISLKILLYPSIFFKTSLPSSVFKNSSKSYLSTISSLPKKKFINLICFSVVSFEFTSFVFFLKPLIPTLFFSGKYVKPLFPQKYSLANFLKSSGNSSAKLLPFALLTSIPIFLKNSIDNSLALQFSKNILYFLMPFSELYVTISTLSILFLIIVSYSFPNILVYISTAFFLYLSKFIFKIPIYIPFTIYIYFTFLSLFSLFFNLSFSLFAFLLFLLFLFDSIFSYILILVTKREALLLPLFKSLIFFFPFA